MSRDDKITLPALSTADGHVFDGAHHPSYGACGICEKSEECDCDEVSSNIMYGTHTSRGRPLEDDANLRPVSGGELVLCSVLHP